MVNLPNVSLIAYDNTDNPEKTFKVIQYCQRYFTFGDAILVCRTFTDEMVSKIKIFSVKDKGYPDAQTFESITLGKYVKTDYSLYVSHDGYILNPDKWNPKWLEYDFIGAPWPPDIVIGNHRVGNTGFCIRSRKFMDLCGLLGSVYRNDMPSDVFACQMMRPLFEYYGIKYAPLDVAADFAWELNIPEYPGGRPDAFGFHGIGDKKVPCTS